jgi:hypothetical protein
VEQVIHGLVLRHMLGDGRRPPIID